MSHKLRQRKQKQKEKQQHVETTANKPPITRKSSNRSSLHQFLYYVIGAVCLFCLRHATHYVTLKRPDLINQIFSNLLRPAVDFLDRRQVLIVGTMSSGTSQVAFDLTNTLGLEIGHELTDALDSHVRDGSSSWFHGIRFFSLENKERIIHDLCFNFTEKMGFHPRQYHATSCSEKKPWFPLSECWRNDCMDLLDKEWGCAAASASADGDGCKDTQPFERTLLQVRDPRSTVDSLVAKFCKDENGEMSLDGTMDMDWIKFHSILFQHDFQSYNCIEAASYYVMEYNHRVLSSMKHEAENVQDEFSNSLDRVMYKVETTPPCIVAKLAGFMDYESVVYKPNYAKVQSKCTFGSVGTKPMGSGTNRVNKGRVRLDWSDYHGGKHKSSRPSGDDSLEKEMRAFAASVGYDPDSPRLTN